MSELLSVEQYRSKAVDQNEHELQTLCVKWFRLSYPGLMIVGIPNAAKRSKAERGRLLGEGMVSGYPDLSLLCPCGGYSALFIEMKTAKGKLSPKQITVHTYLRANNYVVIVPRTFEEFVSGVEDYLFADTKPGVQKNLL